MKQRPHLTIRKWNKGLRFFAAVLIVGGLATGSITFYRVTFENSDADRRSREISELLTQSWKQAEPATHSEAKLDSRLELSDLAPMPQPKLKEPFALLYIPRLSNDVWSIPIVEGTEQDQLTRGIGHYTQSALPGSEGNFSVFGHRTGNGQPFYHFELLQEGDEVIVETKDNWFVYVLKLNRIVPPSATGVTSNSPLLELVNSQFEPYRVITLVTCEPRWTTLKRWVWWGTLEAAYDKKNTPMVISAVNAAQSTD